MKSIGCYHSKAEDGEDGNGYYLKSDINEVYSHAQVSHKKCQSLSLFT